MVAAAKAPTAAAPSEVPISETMTKLARRFLRRGFVEQGNGIGNDAADAERGEAAQDQELRRVARKAGDERRQAIGQHAGNDADAPAIPVADLAEDHRTDQQAEIAGAEDEAHRILRQMPIAQDRRRRDQDRAEIHAVEEQRDKAEREDDDMHAAEPQPVEQFRDVDILRGHDFPPPPTGGPVQGAPGSHLLGVRMPRAFFLSIEK